MVLLSRTSREGSGSSDPPTTNGLEGIELRAQDGALVAEGDIIAVAHRPSSGPPPSVVEQRLKQAVGKNAEMSPDRMAIRAKTYGRLQIEGKKLGVVPPVTIAPDAMSASIDLCAESFSGQPVTTDMVRRSLTAAGVKYGIADSIIAESLRRAHDLHRAPTLVELAQGTPAIAGSAGGFELAFDNQGPPASEPAEKAKPQPHPPVLVHEGEELTHKRLRAAPQPGRNVRGEAIRPPALPADRPTQLRAGENVKLTDDQQSHVCTAPVCGYAEVDNGVLKVTSPITVLDGGMSAQLTVHAAQPGHGCIDEQDVKRLLARLKIVQGIDWPAITSVIDVVRTGQQSHAKAVIARGKAPVRGDDGRLQYVLDLDKKAGLEGEDGRIDYRECSSFVSVTNGQMVCEVVPATAGEPGLDVFGRVIPPTKGHDPAYQPGKGAMWSAGGRQIVATSDGVVVLNGNVVEVCQIVNVRGDVDFATGSIRALGSAVRVGGTVRAGFAVSSMSLFVQEAVEDAEINVQTDLEVRGGILHGSQGRVAAGTVRAGFAQHARIEARDTITIRESAVGCSLIARKLICGGRGKGKLVGGFVRAFESIETWDLGSETELPMSVAIVPSVEEFRVLEAQAERLQETVTRINGLVGEDSGGGGDRGPVSRRRTDLHALVHERDEAKKALSAVLARQRSYLENARMHSRGEILVRGTAHVGVVVGIFGVKLRLSTPRRGCRFHLSESRDEVVTGLL